MKSENEVKTNVDYEVAKTYWMTERGFSQKEYEKVIRNCTAGNFGFCESCMGNMECEIAVKEKYDFTR